MNTRDQMVSLGSQQRLFMEVSYWSIGMSKLKTPPPPQCCHHGLSSMLFNSCLAPWPGASWCQPLLLLAGALVWHEGQPAPRNCSQMSSRGQAAPASALSSLHSPPSVPHFFHTSIFIAIKYHSSEPQHCFRCFVQMLCEGWYVGGGGEGGVGKGNISNIILRPQEQHMGTRRDPESDVLWTGSG